MPENEDYNPNEGNALESTDPKKLDQSQSNKLTDWAYEPTIEDIKGDLEYARQDNSDQKINVDGWLSLRNATGAESGNKTKHAGRSSVQPKLIRKHNEWRYPALSEPFLNTDRMYDIEPRTGEDKASADQNQLVINYQFDTKLNKVQFIDGLVRKTVDEGTSIVRVGWERKTEKVKVQKAVYEYYQLQDEEGLQILTQAAQMFMNDQEAFENDHTIPDDLRAAVEYTLENKIPVEAKEVDVEWVEETKITFNQPSLKLVNVANFFIDPSCEGDIDKAQYVIHTYESTRSELKKRNIYKNLDKVSWDQNTVQVNAGNPDHETSTPNNDSRIGSKKAKVLVYEYWGLCDIHANGIMAPVVVTFIGDTIIQMTENPFPDQKPPFVVIPYMPIDDSVYGEADASLLQDNQRILGAVTRGMIDLLGRSANAQTGYAKGMLDPINRKRFNNGEDFEFNPNSDPAKSMQQMKYPELPASAFQMTQLQNSEAEGLSGVKSFAGGITGDAYGQVARGISGAMDAAGQREMSILRRLAEGMKHIGRKILTMNQQFLEEKEVVRITNGDFVEIRREDLGGHFDLKVDISTAQVDEAKSQDLGFMLQTIGPDMDPSLAQIILGEIADLKRMPALADQIRNYTPEPDPLAVKMQELEIAQLEGKIALEQAKTAEANARAANINLDTQLDADGTNHERSVESMGAQARGNRDLEVTKGLLSGEVEAGNIEAAVGFNKLTEQADRIQAKERGNPPVQGQLPLPLPLAPLQSAPQQVPLNQGLALPQ